MANLAEQTKETAGGLLSILNSKPSQNQLSESSSSYELLMGIFKLMVKKEEYEIRQDELDDDLNDQRQYDRNKRHEDLLEALNPKRDKIPHKEDDEKAQLSAIEKIKKLKFKSDKKENNVDRAIKSIKKKSGSGFLKKALKFGAVAGMAGMALSASKGANASTIPEGNLKDLFGNLPKSKDLTPTSTTSNVSSPSEGGIWGAGVRRETEGPNELKPAAREAKAVLLNEKFNIKPVVGETGGEHESAAHKGGLALDVTLPPNIKPPTNAAESEAIQKYITDLLAQHGVAVSGYFDEYLSKSKFTKGKNIHIVVKDSKSAETAKNLLSTTLSTVPGSVGSAISTGSAELNTEVEKLKAETNRVFSNIFNTTNVNVGQSDGPKTESQSTTSDGPHWEYQLKESVKRK